MRYYYSISLNYHWESLSKMIDENYSHEYDPNDILVLSVHHHQTIDQIKDQNPGHKKIIIYQLEPLVENHWWNIDYIISRLRGADEIWDYDLDNIEILKSYGINAKFKPFRYTESLKNIDNLENPDIDVFFYGTLTEHRSKILEIITNCNLIDKTTLWSYGLSEELLKEFIGRSKIILDLQDNNNFAKKPDGYIQKQSRIFYSLINNKCVVSEKSKKNYFGDLIIECDEKNLGYTLDYLLENDRWKQYSNVSEKFKNMSLQNISNNLKKLNEEKRIKKLEEIETAWTDHIHFAKWIVEKTNPKVVVDLGVDYAYSTFCFALPGIGHVYGIDSFEGDSHAGFKTTYDYVLEKKEDLQLNNVTFIKGYFDDVAKTWDKQIDILHIDGLHTYEAVKNDYETWAKFLKEDGIILFHDTLVEERNFGVKKFFEEINLPKVNFTCSYGLGVVSKNKRIIEEISNTFNIPIKNQKEDKVAIFYHLHQTRKWEELFEEQMNSLVNCGLYEKCDFIHIGINGNEELPFLLDKMKVEYHEDMILEAYTLKRLWEFCNSNPDYKVLYFHSKGVTWLDDPETSITTTSWRKYLEYFVIENWLTCNEDLNSYDCVGTEWVYKSKLWNHELQKYEFEINPHYCGNFWWANAEYIKKLDLNYIFNEEKGQTRWKSELWIGTKKPKFKSYHNSYKSLYYFNYTPNHYIKE